MRRMLPIAIVAGLVWTFPAAAVDEHHPTQQKSAPAATQSGTMMENMEKMQRQMEKIQATTDLKERQKLMQEHMQTMQENMKAMRDMGGPMMMPGGERDDMKMGNKKGMKGGDMMKHREMMEKRMNMMQMMMEQMLQHQGAQEMMPAPK